jgi:predicted lactoylglutathione lyase
LDREKKKPVQPIHVALRAPSKEAVHQFHSAALKAGAKDNGPPGFRREYGDDYYAAFLLDFDGNNIEACYFGEKARLNEPARSERLLNLAG